MENLIKYSPVIIIFHYYSKNEKIWHPPVSSSRRLGRIYRFSGRHFAIFLCLSLKKYTNYIMSTCFGCEIQTVYSCLNRTEITENRHQKLKPNRTEPNRKTSEPWQPKLQWTLFQLHSVMWHTEWYSVMWYTE